MRLTKARTSSVVMIVAALWASAGVAMGDVVVTRDGKTLIGKATWVAGGLVVATGKGKVTVPMADVASATFDSPTTTRPTRAATRPAEWTPFDIGVNDAPGRAEIGRSAELADRVVLFDSSKGFHIKKKGFDNFFLFGQKIRGDVTLTARLRQAEETRLARAGLMARASLETDSPMAMVSRGIEGESSLFRRSTPAGVSEESAKSPSRILGAAWLRLVRQGNTFSAYESTDGKAWTSIGSCEIAMEEEIYVGLAAHSGGIVNGRTLFDKVELKADAPAGSVQRTPRGLVARGGSFLAGEVTRITDAQIDLARPDGGSVTIPAADMARCVLAPLLPALEEKLRTAPAGVMLNNGDFLAGQVNGLADGQIKVTSVLFGTKMVDARREAAGVVLRGVKEEACEYEVRLADRSVLRVGSIKLAGDKLVIKDGVLGDMKARVSEIVGVRRP